MIAEIYPLIAARLKAQVPELIWIDLDQQQFEEEDQNYAIGYPAVLIDFDDANWQDIGEGIQNGDMTIKIRLGVQVMEDVYNQSTQLSAAMLKLQLANKVHKALQNWQGEGFNKLTRVTSGRRPSNRSIWIYEMVYRTLVTDLSAVTVYDTPPTGIVLTNKPVWLKQ